jgi:hypothetical protein
MPQENQEPVAPIDNTPPSDNTPKSDLPPVDLEEVIKERLKPIKGKLDAVFTERDQLANKVREYEAKERANEVERLKKAGELEAAYELQLQELRNKNAQLEQQNTTMARDTVVQAQLSSLEFRNAKARDVALREITAELVRTETGWQSKDGKSIEEATAAYLADPDNAAILLKPKVNAGGGSGGAGAPRAPVSGPKSVAQMTPDELMKAATERAKMRGLG